MTIYEKCPCGASINVEDPTIATVSAEMRDTLADFRIGHRCSSGGSGRVASVPTPF